MQMKISQSIAASKLLERRVSHDWCACLFTELYTVCINTLSFHIIAYEKQLNTACRPLSSTHWGDERRGVNENRGTKDAEVLINNHMAQENRADFVWRLLIICNYILKMTFSNHISGVQTLSSTSVRRAQLGLSYVNDITIGPHTSRDYIYNIFLNI